MTAPRVATCRCGQLRVECSGDPVRVSACHCLACQQRSGSAFATQVRFPKDKVTMTGEAREWVRTADSGNPTTYHFCPVCGATLWYQGGPMPDAIAVPLGNFEDPWFAAPAFSVWEARKHKWVEIVGEGIAHRD